MRPIEKEAKGRGMGVILVICDDSLARASAADERGTKRTGV